MAVALNSLFDLRQTVCGRFRAMKAHRIGQFRYCVWRLYQVTERFCNRPNDSGWRGFKQAVHERTSLDDLDTQLAGVGNGQMFGVVGNYHHLLPCRFIFFIKAVDDDQGGGDQVTVVVMHPSRNTAHEALSSYPVIRCPWLAAC